MELSFINNDMYILSVKMNEILISLMNLPMFSLGGGRDIRISISYRVLPITIFSNFWSSETLFKGEGWGGDSVIFKRDQLLKKRICSYRSKFFSSRVDPF